MSSRSGVSAHGGPQSTHIAQHLRRASIIESRKARLAERAAHAENVRLRAAMAKAAPRASTNSEERALAAYQAREKYLALVRTNCAEEVKRAKKVAEDNRERKAAESLKMKEVMEERLAEADRRRNAQQASRRPRIVSLPPVEEKTYATKEWRPRTAEEAVRLIQKVWRNSQRRGIISQFRRFELNIENMQKSNFEEAGTLLNNTGLLLITAKVLKFCDLPIGDRSEADGVADVRRFLSAYLVVCFPQEVLSYNGEQEVDLISRAKSLLSVFEDLLRKGPSPQKFSPLPEQLALLSEAFCSFSDAFAAWKAHDSSILQRTMVAQFVELDGIWQSVKNDTIGEVAADYHEGIQHNQTLILARLKRLAGQEQAMKMIKDGIRISRKGKSKNQPKLDSNTQGRTANNSISEASSPQSSIASQTRNTGPSISDWRYEANELSKLYTRLPDNRSLTHELAINKNYLINAQYVANTRDTVNRAVLERMRNDIEQGRGDAWLIAKAASIRETMLRWLPEGKSFHTLISEALDPTVMESQLKNGDFSYEKFFAFMDSILPKLCAPIRDAEVRAFANDHSSDLIERLAKLSYLIDVMSVDQANFIMRKSAPFLIKGASQYEEGFFLNNVATAPLVKTLRWWERAKDQVLEDSTRRTNENRVESANGVTFDRIYIQGLIELAISIRPLSEFDLPETLELDHTRFDRMRFDILHIITSGAIIVTAKSLLKRDVRSQWKTEALRMKDLPFDDAASYLAVIESTHAMPDSTKTHLSGTIERVLNDARSQTATHSLVKVLFHKIKAHVLTRLSASNAEERSRNATTANEALALCGLVEFVIPVGEMVDELVRVWQVDRESHGRWYNEIAAHSTVESTI